MVEHVHEPLCQGAQADHYQIGAVGVICHPSLSQFVDEEVLLRIIGDAWVLYFIAA